MLIFEFWSTKFSVKATKGCNKYFSILNWLQYKPIPEFKWRTVCTINIYSCTWIVTVFNFWIYTHTHTHSFLPTKLDENDLCMQKTYHEISYIKFVLLMLYLWKQISGYLWGRVSFSVCGYTCQREIPLWWWYPWSVVTLWCRIECLSDSLSACFYYLYWCSDLISRNSSWFTCFHGQLWYFGHFIILKLLFVVIITKLIC